MARSLLQKIQERVIALIIFGLVFGFVPFMLYKSACGTTNQAKVNEEYGQVKRFGAPQEPVTPKPPVPPTTEEIDEEKNAAAP